MKIIVEHWRWHDNINIAPGLSSWISNYIISGTMLNAGKYPYTKYLLMTSKLIISLNHWMRPQIANTKKWSKVGEVSPPREKDWNNKYTHIYIIWGIRKYEGVYGWLNSVHTHSGFLNIHVTWHTKTQQREYLLNRTVRYVNDSSHRQVTHKVSRL